MKRPSKKAIRAAVENLKDKGSSKPGAPAPESDLGRPSSKKSSMRIRKKGV